MSVVIAARDAEATLGRTLDALAAQDLGAPFETIVVDDASSDATADVAERAPLSVRLVRLDTRAGAGSARNAGVEVAGADVIAFTDADCIPSPGWLREGLEALARADLVQGRVEPDPTTPISAFAHTVWVTGASPLYETANLLIHRSLFERLGGFVDWRPAAGRPFGEDVWLGWRARRGGARIAFAGDALVHHAVVARTAAEYLAEQQRLAWFPELVRRVPELRDELLHAGLFLTPRRARFALALTGVAIARRGHRALGLAAMLPYAAEIGQIALPNGRRAPLVGAVEAAADAAGLAALVAGSVRSRTPVL